MRKLLLPLLAVSWLGAQTAFAVVTVQADDNVGVSFFGDVNAANNNPSIASNPTLKNAVATGDDLLPGNRILVGSFTISDSEIVAHATDVGYLISHFQMYGAQASQTKVGDSYPGTSQFSNQITGNADTSGLVGAQIYLFVLGSTDTTSFATALGTAFQVGVFYEDKAFASNWVFPSESGVPNDTVVDFSDLTTNGAGLTQDSHAHTVIGDFTGTDVNNVTGFKDFRLAAVPEPGSAALALCGGIALILRRRRV